MVLLAYRTFSPDLIAAGCAINVCVLVAEKEFRMCRSNSATHHPQAFPAMVAPPQQLGFFHILAGSVPPAISVKWFHARRAARAVGLAMYSLIWRPHRTAQSVCFVTFACFPSNLAFRRLYSARSRASVFRLARFTSLRSAVASLCSFVSRYCSRFLGTST